DPDLAADTDAADIAAVRKDLTVPVYRLPTGPLPSAPTSHVGRLGYLVLKGLLLYEVSVCGRATAELLGPGDFVRPWPREDSGTLSPEISWTVLEQAPLADLGPSAAPRVTSTRGVTAA